MFWLNEENILYWIQLFIILQIIVFLHELSHFIVAKLFKCNVKKFSIGFGPPIIKKKFRNTWYQIELIPFGGHCDLEGEIKFINNPKAFCNQRYRNKSIISLAGVATNIITGLIACTLFYKISFIWLYLFGYTSIYLGILNSLPIPPLDGSMIFLVLLEKKYGKVKAYFIIEKIIKTGLKIFIRLNAICILGLLLYAILNIG